MASAAGLPSSQPHPGAVARLRGLFEGPEAAQQNSQQEVGGSSRAAAQQEGGSDTPAGSTAPRQQPKRARMATWGPQVLPEQSPSEAQQPEGSVSSPAVYGGMLGRRLWRFEADSSELPEEDAPPMSDAAREALLLKIRARFGTKVFYAPKELPPAELLSQLGASESDLSPEDYKLLRWDPMPVLLNSTSNAHIRNFVLKGMSGCVALASGLNFCFVLGGGQTIFIADADSVQAQRNGQEGVIISFGQGNCVALKADATTTAVLVDAINARAAKRSRLRKKEGGGVGAEEGAAGLAEEGAAGLAASADDEPPGAAGQSDAEA